MTSSSNDKRLPVDYRSIQTLHEAINDDCNFSMFDQTVATLLLKLFRSLTDDEQKAACEQITRPAGDVAENATTANLSNSTPLPEHFRSFHEVPGICDAKNHDVIRALTNSNNLLIHLHGMLFFQNTAHLKRQKLEAQIRENQAALKLEAK